jgi:nickel-dependent lactate racemase
MQILVKNKISIAELIEQHIHQQVVCFNKNIQSKQKDYQTTEQKKLNGYQISEKLALADTEKETYKAFQAFQSNQLIMLVDNKQVTELEEMVEITTKTEIQFIKLMPLVGG